MIGHTRLAGPLLAGLILGTTFLRAVEVEGRVTDGHQGLAGVQVYPDRQPRVSPDLDPPVAVTDAQGRFHLTLAPSDDVLAVEKDGWHRDLIPAADWGANIVLTPEPHHHEESVLVVRLAFKNQPSQVSDAALRQILFSRRPGVASAANYLYEVSKGALSLVEGEMLHLQTGPFPPASAPSRQADLVTWVLNQIHKEPLPPGCDRVNNATGAAHPDGKPDHLWIISAGNPETLTDNPKDLRADTWLMPLPWDAYKRWPVVLMPETSPLGNIVHEAFHAMGEESVDDLYLDCDHPNTAGIWDLMDAGQYRGWDRSHPGHGPWVDDTGYSPSHPSAWVRSELWYRGRYRETVTHLAIKGRAWEGWIRPVAQAPEPGPHPDPQWVTVPDPRRKGRFWSLEVRRPWGFERGRVGGRFGPGHAGLIVALVDPSKLSPDEPKGAVHVVDAHPGTPEPPKPRFPCDRWQLDDAAFNLGPGEQAKGHRGNLSWEVLATDAAGRMKVRLRLHVTRRPRKR